MPRTRARLVAYLPAMIASLAIGAFAVRAILRDAGRPAAPLDDAFIHFQYARRLAEGHFMSYAPGGGYTTGATSFLWPTLLAPFWLLGFRGLSIVWIAWLFGTIAHAGVAVEAYRLADRLAGKAAALGAAAMCLSFGAFAWFAWSSMETVPLAWVLLRTARASGDLIDEEGSASMREVIALGVIAPLVRPEGAIASLIAAAAIAIVARREPSTSSRRRRAILAALPLAAPLLVPLCHLVFAGHATSSTATVKWLFANPFYDASTRRAYTMANVRLLVSNVLNGGEWTTVFLPEGSALALALGLVALPIAAIRRRRRAHGIFVAMVALGALLPCTYLSFLWNRVRYVWPFAGAWFVMLACLAREAGDLIRIRWRRTTAVTPALAGAFACALATKLPWSLRDLANSARAIDQQQVKLGEWAKDALPDDARIGVNDTGAIAYESDRATFDVCGLTTEGEAKYWDAGPASRFEHYERLAKEAKEKLPTHFIVYPHWMDMPAVLGQEMEEASVYNQSILGGTTMIAYRARWDLLGSGELPVREVSGELVDAFDVADLESEAAHAYDRAGSRDTDEVAMMSAGRDAWADANAKVIADGGRMNRREDAFDMQLPSDRAAALVMRVEAEDDTPLTVTIDDEQVAETTVRAGDWVEPSITLPKRSSSRARVVVRAPPGLAFTSFHYWAFAITPR